MTLEFSNMDFDISKGIQNTPEGYLPSGKVINIEADGSGDFATLSDAISYLTGKWSDGTITLELGTGTFDLDTTVVLDGRLFNIPLVNIEGQGTSETILESKLAAGEFVLQIRYGTKVAISKIRFYHASATTSSTYRGLRVSDCSNLSIKGDVVMEGLDRALWPTTNGTIELSGTITFNTSKDAIYTSGGFVCCEYQTTFNFNTVNRCFAVFEGGQIHLYEPVINKTSVTKTCNLSVNTAVNEGWITGVTL